LPEQFSFPDSKPDGPLIFETKYFVKTIAVKIKPCNFARRFAIRATGRGLGGAWTLQRNAAFMRQRIRVIECQAG
jgi:hypothetical protein